MPATSRVSEMVNVPGILLQYSRYLFCAEKNWKSSLLKSVSVFVCVLCLFHMNIFYICTRCVIVHQYLANIQTLIWVMPATLSSPGYWWCFCALQRQTLQVNKNIWARNQDFSLEGVGLGDDKTSTINASLMQIVNTVDYLKINLPQNKKGGIASVGYCDGTITKLLGSAQISISSFGRD